MNGTYNFYKSHSWLANGRLDEKEDMRKDSLTHLPIAIAFLIPILAIAQTASPVTQSPGQTSKSQTKEDEVSADDESAGGVKKTGSDLGDGNEKNHNASDGVVSKSKDVARGAGDATIKGVKSLGRAGGRIFSHGESDLQAQVRRLLEENSETRYWRFEVKKRRVTIKTPPNHKADIGAVVSNIRQIPGVESVFVIAL
jgi:hypothetical protein